jgi:4-amino-4-deoxy-L-arabinose transferase-like glycosyltransferase
MLGGLFGWKLGPFLVSPLAALVCLWLMYALSRKFGLSASWSFAGASVLAAFPLFLFQAIQPMSDVLAMAWTTAAVLAALQSRKHPGWAWAAGAAVGISVLVRPTNVLILLPLVFALPAKPKIYLRLVLGGLPFALFLGTLNWILYGSPLTDGYRGGQLASLTLSLAGKNIIHYGLLLASLMTFILPLAWLLVPLNRSVEPRTKWLLIVWFAPFFILYNLFDFMTGWTYARYFLPGAPALILAGMIWLRDGTGFLAREIRHEQSLVKRPLAWPGRIPAALALLVCGLILAVEIRQVKRLGVLDADGFEAAYKIACLAANETLPQKSIVLSGQTSGALTYYTKTLPCMLEALKPGQFEELRQKAALRGYGMFALLFPSEEGLLSQFAPGAWTKIATYKFITLWKFQGS